MDDPTLLNNKELRAALGVSHTTLYDVVRRELPVVKIGNATRYRRTDVLDYIERHVEQPRRD